MQLVSGTQHIIGYKCNVTCEFLDYNCTTLIKNKRNLFMDAINKLSWKGEWVGLGRRGGRRTIDHAHQTC